MAWTVETLNGTVDAELAGLPADMRARLPEFRSSSKHQEDKTAAGEIELALQRAKELKP